MNYLDRFLASPAGFLTALCAIFFTLIFCSCILS